MVNPSCQSYWSGEKPGTRKGKNNSDFKKSTSYKYGQFKYTSRKKEYCIQETTNTLKVMIAIIALIPRKTKKKLQEKEEKRETTQPLEVCG